MPGYYFDYNATTPLATSVLQAMMPYLTEHYGNPSSLHEMGQTAAKALKDARRKAAALLGASEDSEIIFTSGATESNNAAIRSALYHSKNRKEIITSAVEHSSVRKLCYQLAKEGFVVHEVGVNADGRLDADLFYKLLSEKTAVVSLMMANNETGIFFPVEEIGIKVKEKGAFFHVDGVQVVGKRLLNLKKTPLDFFSVSAHKFYGPKGMGALYVRKGVPFQPLISGGSQERGRRAGTENLPGIAGLGAACDLIASGLEAEILRLNNLKETFESEIKKKIPNVLITGEGEDRLANTSHIRFSGIEAETLLMALDQKGIYASSGSACMSGAQDPSHVLKAMGFSDEDAKSSVRFSFGLQTSESSLYVLISELRDTVHRLRSMNSHKAAYAEGMTV